MLRSRLQETILGLSVAALFILLVAMTIIIYASGKVTTVETIYPTNNVVCVIVSRGARADVECSTISSDPAAPYRKQPNIRPMTDAELRQLEREKLYD